MLIFLYLLNLENDLDPSQMRARTRTVALREVGGLVPMRSVLGGVRVSSGILVSDTLCLESLLLTGRLECSAVSATGGPCGICIGHWLLHETAERPPGSRVLEDRPEIYIQRHILHILYCIRKFITFQKLMHYKSSFTYSLGLCSDLFSFLLSHKRQ